MINAAIIGLGVVGEVHLSAIKSIKNSRLVAACDTDPAKKNLLPPEAAFYTDFEELLRREKPDVIHVCLPHFLHYPITKKIAGAGINVFAEKPLALNTEEGEKFCLLEKQYGVKICLCLQNRLNETSEALYGILSGGEYGKITGIRGSVAWYRSKEYYEASPWRGIMAESGGGCMINQAIHTLDLMQYFAGSPAVNVKGNTGQILDYGVEVEDTVSAHMVFENGCPGFFTASLANYADENVEISVHCEKGNFIIRDQKLFRVKDGEEELLAADRGTFAGKQVYGAGHVKLIELFYRAIENGYENYIHPEEGMPALRIIASIRKSGETGKTVIL